jgi:hypothetical protein
LSPKELLIILHELETLEDIEDKKNGNSIIDKKLIGQLIDDLMMNNTSNNGSETGFNMQDFAHCIQHIIVKYEIDKMPSLTMRTVRYSILLDN